VYLAILKRITTAAATMPESKCKATHTSLATLLEDQKHDFGTNCRNIGCVETRPEVIGSKLYLPPGRQAPYISDFCAHYHEHSKSAKCFVLCKLPQPKLSKYLADVFQANASSFGLLSKSPQPSLFGWSGRP